MLTDSSTLPPFFFVGIRAEKFSKQWLFDNGSFYSFRSGSRNDCKEYVVGGKEKIRIFERSCDKRMLFACKLNCEGFCCVVRSLLHLHTFSTSQAAVNTYTGYILLVLSMSPKTENKRTLYSKRMFWPYGRALLIELNAIAYSFF